LMKSASEDVSFPKIMHKEENDETRKLDTH
jgi:hypothetical protein